MVRGFLSAGKQRLFRPKVPGHFDAVSTPIDTRGVRRDLIRFMTGSWQSRGAVTQSRRVWRCRTHRTDEAQRRARLGRDRGVGRSNRLRAAVLVDRDVGEVAVGDEERLLLAAA